ncbi:ECF-type sigma factor [Bythopirellula polymerisocia]|uniref:ECF sigma factor n=1 Tax=Bythopirellula polymerisocia TaxID=2528003 RepID=A0A5C6CTP8_9BACT|nr:ECF-type sigma factor [Bythopirellula polymerisocia]TWU26119.1 ECF sigma factor [Bythopirellula polymerisocia]
MSNRQSPITNHQSPITNHQSPITNHQSPITNHQSPITNHQSQTTFPLASILYPLFARDMGIATAVTYLMRRLGAYIVLLPALPSTYLYPIFAEKVWIFAGRPNTLSPMKDVTLILQQIQEGRAEASADLFPAVYAELRRLATAKMSHERVDHTLSSTALVHEAYVRLVDTDTVRHWDSRAHFFSAAAEAMRRILIDHARQKLATKRGGDLQRHAASDDLAVLPADPAMLIDLNEAIERLEASDAESAEMLKLVLFAGSSVAEAGRLLGMTRDVAYGHWDYIRSWFAVHFDGSVA